jgi:hypothetical protein
MISHKNESMKNNEQYLLLTISKITEKFCYINHLFFFRISVVCNIYQRWFSTAKNSNLFNFASSIQNFNLKNTISEIIREPSDE